MELHQAEDVSVDEFCDFDWCQVLATLEFETTSDSYRTLFSHQICQRFGATRSPYDSVFRIAVVRDIETRSICPSCRVTNEVIQHSKTTNITSDTVCYVQVYDADLYWNIGYYHTDGMFRPITRHQWEQITLLSNSSLSHYRSARLVESAHVDYARIDHWLQLCHKFHTLCTMPTDRSYSNQEEVLPQLRVVDVQDMCLTEVLWTERYVALSYVWGGATPPLLLKSEMAFWKTTNSINTRRSSFPQTILDAMEVVRNLKSRYFWFDSLCLLQDDADDLRRSINNMDLIYEGAYFTIVAADSTSANDALPGVGRPRAPNQRIYHIRPDISLALLTPHGVYLKNSVWGSRGWTYARPTPSVEFLLSALTFKETCTDCP